MNLLARLFAGIWALCLAMGSFAAHAQADPGVYERTYDARVLTKAQTNKTAAEVAEEQNRARSHQTACSEGDRSGCNALGEAYEFGIGLPQNRVVAGILYSETCAAGDATGCFRFGRVTAQANFDNAPSDAAAIQRKACELGSPDGCAVYAVALIEGRGVEPDAVAGERLLRQTCNTGGREACRELALLILRNPELPEENVAALSLLERGCSERRAKDCADFISFKRDMILAPGPMTTAQALSHACDARDAYSCDALGNMALKGEGIARDRAFAQKMYDLACEHADDASEDTRCEAAAIVRSEPDVKARCNAGEIEGCARLGEIYVDVLTGLYDPALAQPVLDAACSQGIYRTCVKAAWLRLDSAEEPDAAQVAALLERGCGGGDEPSCLVLAKELDGGTRLPEDKAKAYRIYADLCEANSPQACDFLEERAVFDPAAPMPTADGRYVPPIDPDDSDAALAYLSEGEKKERARACSTGETEFRGRAYTDRICTPKVRVLNGFRVDPGGAPWQALIWRPERNERGFYDKAARVGCGGTIIRPGWILTAAHCLLEKRGKKYFGIRYGDLVKGHTIRLGVNNPRNDEGLIFPIKSVYMHPKFNPNRDYVFDIALVRYDPEGGTRMGALSNKIAAIGLDPLPATGDRRRIIKEDQEVYTYGWGWTAALRSSSTAELRGAKLKLRSEKQCTSITGFTGDLEDAALCAAGSGGQQACYGDSGGPLVLYGPPKTRPVVIGVVSSGKDCGTAGKPSYYTRVAAAREWIDDVLAGRVR